MKESKDKDVNKIDVSSLHETLGCKSMDVETNIKGEALNIKYFDSISSERIREKSKGFSGDLIERVRRNMSRSSYGIMLEPVEQIEVYKGKDDKEIMEFNEVVISSINLVLLVSELIALKGNKIVYKDLKELKDKYEGEDND